VTPRAALPGSKPIWLASSATIPDRSARTTATAG
jgi:hypothetical protein